MKLYNPKSRSGLAIKSLIKLKILVLIFLTSSILGCKKILQVPAPLNSVNGENVYTSDQTAIQAITAIYASLSDDNLNIRVNYYSSFFFFAGLSADELELYDRNYLDWFAFYSNTLSPNSGPGASYWTSTYSLIFRANAGIQGLSASKTLSPGIRNQLLGEALFLRAYSYFFLVNTYGDIPLITGTDPNINRLIGRTSSVEVYKQIIKDLIEAQGLLGNNFLEGDLKTSKSSTPRVRPTKWVAKALLARVNLYAGNYSDAVLEATGVINNNTQFKLEELSNVFLNNSQEVIWGLQSVGNDSNSGFNAGESRLILPATGPGTSGVDGIYLSDFVLNSFEAGDGRKSSWVGTITTSTGKVFSYANKYKAPRTQINNTESHVEFRLAEQYLIRAEANAQLKNISEAVLDLNILRNRARLLPSIAIPNPLPPLSSSLTGVDLLKAIEHERQIELFTENGHRWFDLKRTSGFTNPSLTRADEVLPIVSRAKGTTWNNFAKLFPIPESDLSANPNLTGHQNPGY
ncbi:RagB/SusD family nutrient uptake outer membrane protein [Pedobacter aquatilis]|uniref:RagB/SusD family nutrient uptake outer membrane protein n=1 Tax=Pedobacter aquatilis TaxID=351343 RepID=UPI00292E41DD|nr:RagB/SusD family nutrient uptake outer membrane protein [Pedobacter aquatilis]